MGRFVALFLLCMTLYGTAFAAGQGGPFVCEKLKDEKAYARKSGYKILIDGRDGAIFRTTSDLKTQFTIKKENLLYFKLFKQALLEKGTELIVITPPTRGIMMSGLLPDAQKVSYGFDEKSAFESYLAFTNRLHTYGIHIADFSDARLPMENYFYKRDHHWTPEGARDSAQRVAAAAKKIPAYQDIPKTPYASEPAGPGAKPGSFAQFIEESCAIKIPREPMTKYQTQAVGADLFGDPTAPDIALVGTSNCTDEAVANFPGWLREYLSADIDNHSIGGGGPDTPMLSYLIGGDFAARPPKILIWEFASHYRFTKDFISIFRQAIPAAKGACQTSKLADVSGKADKKLVVYDGAAPLSPSQGYIHLTFQSPAKQPVSIDAVYDGGIKKTYKISRDARFKPSPEYFYLLDEEPLSALKNLTVTLPGDTAGQAVSAQICPM